MLARCNPRRRNVVEDVFWRKADCTEQLRICHTSPLTPAHRMLARVAGGALAARAQYSVGSASELALHVEAAVRHAEIVEPVGHMRCICSEESKGCSTAAEAHALWLPVAAPERFQQETSFVESPLS